MIEINLIPDVKRELIRAQSVRRKVISLSIVSSIAVVGLVVVLAVYVFGAQGVRGVLADNEITKKGDELSKVEDLSKIITLQNQLKVISELHGDKMISSRVLDMLKSVIPPSPNEARISQFSVESEDGIIRLEGQTRSFDSMEIFKKTIDAAVITYTQDGEEQQVKLAEDISATDTSFGEDATGARTFRFTLSFKYAEELFSSSIDKVNFKLVVNGNVTDSYLGIPKTVFTQASSEEGED